MKKQIFFRMILASLAVGGILSLIALLICLSDGSGLSADQIQANLPYALGCIGICLIGIIPLAGLVYLLFYLFQNPHIKTAIHLLANKLSAKVRLKNTNIIYPRLCEFLYETLEINKDFLKLPIGQDCSSLVPKGFRPIYRQDCNFYIFQLVMPEKPSCDEKTLKQLVQSYIDGELINFGCAGLSSCFNSRTYGIVPSVYIDRLHYIESQHMLNFAVIYACSEDDACYIVKAKQRDKEEAQVARSIYDDEL